MAWTERYLAAVLRSIPEPKRADVERELRSSIDDAIEERTAAGEDRTAAERTVLEDLGDPAQLAGAYTGRPTYLVGPELFPLYRKFVPRVIAAALPIAATVQVAVKLLGGGQLNDAIAAGIGGAIEVGIQIAFWATVTFVFLEWAGPARQARAEIVAAGGRWTLERLPKAATGRITVAEAAGEIVTVLITLGIFVFIAGLSTTDASGAPVPVFAREFSSVWLPILLSAIALRGAVHLKAYATGSWTRWLAVYHAVLQAAFGVLMVTLALSGWIVNPAFGDAIGVPGLADGKGPVMLTLVVGTTLATGWEIVRILLRHRRADAQRPLVGAPSQPA
jgi:hypothetical protein